MIHLSNLEANRPEEPLCGAVLRPGDFVVAGIGRLPLLGSDFACPACDHACFVLHADAGFEAAERAGFLERVRRRSGADGYRLSRKPWDAEVAARMMCANDEEPRD